MIQIPQEILNEFDKFLRKENVEAGKQVFFRKWLRYYLDFCHKYKHDSKSPDSLPLFINKLRDKKQSRQQQKQAFDSITIYYKIFNVYPDWSKKTAPEKVKEK